MTQRTLHIIDPTTPPEALETLAQWIAATPELHHEVLALGPQRVMLRATEAGVPRLRLQNKRAIGWADPSAWHSVGRALHAYDPATLHVWGVWGMVAGSLVSSYIGGRVLSLTGAQLRPRRLISWATRWIDWVVTFTVPREQAIWTALKLPTDRMIKLTPSVTRQPLPPAAIEQLRARCGLDATSHPVLLIDAPDNPHARPDHALWAAAIIQQIYPHTRVLLRLSRTQPDLRLRDFAQSLGNPEMLRFANEDIPLQHLASIADVFVFPPDQSHSTAPLLHALAAGIPIVATATSENSSILEDNVHALLGRPGKPRLLAGRLERLLSDPALAATLRGNAASAFATACNPATAARNLALAYDRCRSPTPALSPAAPAGI